jgi:protein-L-isoaspartate O-methyltransferase
MPENDSPGTRRLVQEIEAYAFHTGAHGTQVLRPARDERDRTGSRHEFVPREIAASAISAAAADRDRRPSQPFIVALMTDLAEIAPTITLEISTGADTAAVLSLLAERGVGRDQRQLEEAARNRLARRLQEHRDQAGDGAAGPTRQVRRHPGPGAPELIRRL